MEVRRLTAEDAPSLHEAILASLPELRPWMPWAAEEPREVGDRVELIGRWAHEWEPGGVRSYGMVDGGQVVGCCGFPRWAGDGLEIGYWVRTDRTGQGLCTDAVRQLLDIALAGVPYVEIHHDEANARSGRIPEKLGFDFVGTVERDRAAPGETEVTCIWRLHR